MAITKKGMGSYYPNEGPEIPAAGGDYGAPTPHASKVGQHPFTAPTSLPSTDPAPEPHAAFDAIDGPVKVTKAGSGTDGSAKGISPSTAFNPRPSQWG